MSEATIQGELYRYLKNHIDSGKATYDGIKFKNVESGKSIKTDGRTIFADLVVSDSLGRSWLVVEMKRETTHGYSRSILDPYSPDVLRQAAEYADYLGATYYATCNGRVLVLLQRFEAFVPLSQRKRIQYDLRKISMPEFVDKLLGDMVGLQQGSVKWLDIDEAFIARMRTLHDATSPLVLESLSRKRSTDLQFENEYKSWVESQGWEFNKDTHQHVASMAAHLLINKILFYKILETYNPPSRVKPLDTIERSTADLTAELKRYFKAIVSNIDYKPVYEETFYDSIPIPPELLELLKNFVEELSLTNLKEIKADVIGTMYERLIPKDERKALGQFYTPPQVIEFIIRTCTSKSTDRILDPCCGSGGFLVIAYHRLLELKRAENPLLDPDKAHKELLQQIHGVEINQFPAHLSTINLAIQDVKSLTNEVNIETDDFFKVKPRSAFTAVVANPPYIRQESIVNKSNVLRATAEGFDGIEVDAQSDIFVYFFIHGAKFLQENGRIGFITSDKWLEVGYGEPLQRFFLQNFKVRTIVAFDTGVFEDADVNTCVTILEREGEEKARNGNDVRFIRLKKPMEIDALVNMLEQKGIQDTDNFRLVTVRQEHLLGETKWSLYHKAPRLYWRILASDRLVHLSSLAKPAFAVKTGVNQFFVVTKKVAKQWGIGGMYLRPAITDPGKHPNILLEKQDLDEYFFVCNEDRKDINNEGARAYIEWGENAEYVPKQGKEKGKVLKGFQNVNSVRGRKRWYDLGPRDPAPIVIPRRCDVNFRCFWNKAEALALDVFYHVYPLDSKNTEYLLAVLNSTVTPFLIEPRGRSYALGVLEIEVYELESLPVPDPSKIPEIKKRSIVQAFHTLVKTQETEDRQGEREARRKLDELVLSALGLPSRECGQLYLQLEELRKIRREREKGVLVQTREKPRFRTSKRKPQEVGGPPTAVLAKWFPKSARRQSS